MQLCLRVGGHERDNGHASECEAGNLFNPGFKRAVTSQARLAQTLRSGADESCKNRQVILIESRDGLLHDRRQKGGYLRFVKLNKTLTTKCALDGQLELDWRAVIGGNCFPVDDFQRQFGSGGLSQRG